MLDKVSYDKDDQQRETDKIYEKIYRQRGILCCTTMKKLFYIFLIVTSRLCAQDIDVKLDTLFPDPSIFYKKYVIQKTEKIGGEGFELVNASKLRHAFYGDRPGNPYYACGSWTILDDSIVFFISNKRLLTTYGYKSRESYRPLLISWDLRTDLRNTEDKLLVFKNKLVILNNVVEPNDLLDQLRAMIALKLEKLKAEANSDDVFYFFQLNEKVAKEFYDLLYEKKLFASLDVLKNYE